MAVTDARVKAVMTELLSDSVAFPSTFDDTVTEVNLAATNYINAQLRVAGYSATQIAAWVRLDEYTLNIAVFLLLPRVLGLQQFETTTWDVKYKRYYDDLLHPDRIALLDGSGDPINPSGNLLPNSNTLGLTPMFDRDNTGFIPRTW